MLKKNASEKMGSCLVGAVMLSAWTAFIALLGPSLSALEPPRPGEIHQLRTTGELAARLKLVKQLRNHRFDSYLLERTLVKAQRLRFQAQGIAEADLDQLMTLPAPPPGRRDMPTTGNIRVLALLIEFQDHTHTSTRDDIHDFLFGAGDAARFPVVFWTGPDNGWGNFWWGYQTRFSDSSYS